MKNCPRCGVPCAFPTGSNTLKAMYKVFGDGVKVCDTCWFDHRYTNKRRKDEIEKVEGQECAKCHGRFPREQFYHRSSSGIATASSKKRHSYCRNCAKDIAKLSATKSRKKHLSERYGLSIEDFDALAAHGCQICRATRDERVLVVDHDHDTGLFRGILCSQCNTALGLFGDDPEKVFDGFYYLYTRKNVKRKDDTSR